MNEISNVARNAVMGAEFVFTDWNTHPEAMDTNTFVFGVNICDFDDYTEEDRQAVFQLLIDRLVDQGFDTVRPIDNKDIDTHSMMMTIRDESRSLMDEDRWNEIIEGIQGAFEGQKTSTVSFEEYYNQSQEPACSKVFVQADMAHNHG